MSNQKSEFNQKFYKATGNTWDAEKLLNEGKISKEKLAWMIPDGAMLDNIESPKFSLAKEFMEVAGIPTTGKVNIRIEKTENNVEKPEGEGWKKVITVTAVEGHAEYWVLAGVEYNEDPTYIESDSYDYVFDETSWNESEADGALAKYHEKYPEEDWWNNSANRAVNYNDRVYVGTIDDVEVTATATWASEAAQKLTIDGVDYYGAIFYGFDPQDIALFNDIALTESADKTLVITSIGYSEDCGRSWAGAVNNPGAQYPWVCPIFDTDVNAKVIFRYEGANDAKPWGDKVFNAGDWGCESVAKIFGNDFDINKFSMILEQQGVEHFEAVEPVEEVYHWEREII